MTPWRLPVLLALLVVLAGCGSGPTPTLDPLPSPDEVAPRDPSPSASGEATTDADEFIDHLNAMDSVLRESVAKVATAIIVGDDLDIATANLALAVAVADEVEWANGVVPEPCYANELQDYLDLLHAWQAASLQVSNGDQNSAGEALESSIPEFRALIERLEGLEC